MSKYRPEIGRYFFFYLKVDTKVTLYRIKRRKNLSMHAVVKETRGIKILTKTSEKEKPMSVNFASITEANGSVEIFVENLKAKYPSLNRRELSWYDICQVQNLLNTLAIPDKPNWQQERSIDDYVLEQCQEFGELVESNPHKWWKKGSTEIFNSKIEIIDMIHFIASEIILEELKPSPSYGIDSRFDDTDLNLPIVWKTAPSENYRILDKDGKFVRKSANSIYKQLLNGEIKDKLEVVAALCSCFGATNEMMSAVFIAKAELNAIRWKGGYILDAYKKLKDSGKEDNSYLESVITSFLADRNMMLVDIPKYVKAAIEDADKERVDKESQQNMKKG
jgi:hypothetical protein